MEPTMIETLTTSGTRAMHITWPDTSADHPSRDHPYRSAIWLLGRHPRLARLAARICGVVYVDEDGDASIDLDHLGDVFAADPVYDQAWADYEDDHRPPADEEAYHRWLAGGPNAEDFAAGLCDLAVMSSGEVASLRLLATLGTTEIPFKLGHLRSRDSEGQRLLADWCSVVLTA
jgi:hypothetical protein